jgi:creatinine amidohydrolase
METLKYIEMTYNELDALDRAGTVFLSALSPIETHGSHLPLGTDIFIAEWLRDRIAEKIAEKHPGFRIVYLPTMAMGSDSIPVKGSVRVRHQAIHGFVADTGKTLAELGFKYWILTDNHGGPHHQIAIEMASRELAEKGLRVIAPFHTEFRRMVAHDPDLVAKTGLGSGACGDSDDAHAGTNETSLMLASHPEKVREVWKKTGPAKKSPKKLPYHLLSGAAQVFRTAGAVDAATDFDFLAEALTWVDDPNMAPYQGDPSAATPEAGKAMLEYRVNLAVELFENALAGKKTEQKPLGWSIRALRNLI